MKIETRTIKVPKPKDLIINDKIIQMVQDNYQKILEHGFNWNTRMYAVISIDQQVYIFSHEPIRLASGSWDAQAGQFGINLGNLNFNGVSIKVRDKLTHMLFKLNLVEKLRR